MIFRRILLALALFLMVRCEPAQAQSFQWNLTPGPGIDPPSVLEIAPDNSIIVGTGRNLFRSIDGGISWQSIPIPKYLGNVVNLVVLPDSKLMMRTSLPAIVRMTLDGNIEATSPLRTADWIMGSSDGRLFAMLSQTQLARSMDEGNSWDTIAGPSGELMGGFTFDSKNYYVTTGSGIYISNDSGATWKRALNGLPTDPYYSIAAGTNGNVWVTSYTGAQAMFWSGDYGVHWKEITTGSDIHYEIRAGRNGEAITIGTHLTDSILQGIPAVAGYYAYDSTQHWWAGSSGPPDLYESEGGSPWTWKPHTPPLATPSFLVQAYATIMAGFGGSEFVLNSKGLWHPLQSFTTPILGMDYFHNALLGAGTNSLLQSTDSGRSWQNIFGALPSGAVRAVAAPPHRIYAATKGIYYTDDDGYDWSETNDNIFTSPISVLCADSLGNVYAGFTNELYRTTDGGNTWHKAGLAEPIIKLLANSRGTLLALCSGNTIFRSTDFGTTWDWRAMPDQWNITDAVLLPSDDAFISSNNGEYYWKAGYTGLQYVGQGLDSIGVNTLAFDDSGVLYAATAGRGVMVASGSLPTQSVAMNNTGANPAVFPNPASTTLNVTIPSGTINSVIIIDALGRQFPIDATSTNSGLRIDVHNLQNGCYELMPIGGEQHFMARFVISR